MTKYLAVLFAALMMACGSDNNTNNATGSSGSSGATPSGTQSVSITIAPGATGKGPAAFGTNPMVIEAGTQVTWTNADSVAHTATSTTGVFDSGTLNTGQSFSFTFNTPGDFPYICSIHGAASMSGMIRVNPAGSPTPAPLPSPSPSGSPSPSPSPTQSTVSVDIPANAIGLGTAAYGTNPLVVAPGTTVTWTNRDTHPHTVTADDGSFDSGSINSGQSYSHRFAQAGTYTYYCSIHGKASMSGSVVVRAP